MNIHKIHKTDFLIASYSRFFNSHVCLSSPPPPPQILLFDPCFPVILKKIGLLEFYF